LSAEIKYYESTISQKQLSEALARIVTLQADRYDQYALVAFDVPVSHVFIKQSSSKSIVMANCLEDSVFEFVDTERTEFEMVWQEIIKIITQMIPENGREINPVFIFPQ
jgi:hypothetical protein